MTTTPQLKLRGIFLAGDLPENLTNPVGDIFSNVVSAVSNFFQHLISLFNQKFPPEARDEQIHWLLHGATPYLIGAAVLIKIGCKDDESTRTTFDEVTEECVRRKP
ncbi:hypothetical protein E3N88_19594 [Mikania micrantha]|uniref:Uncharacterized protein n=1 Tax=Mikania micrantha TaxID=192012 RepID=A0A5N6NRE6_9ASTR|nr:hypothetical protein E3N88_19594 [Mikania micrantha]